MGLAIREIKTSELAIQFFGSSIVSMSSIFGICKPPKILSLAIFTDLGYPLASALVPIDTLVTRRVVDLCRTIAKVLLMCAKTKILSCVIQTIAINMVNTCAWFSPKNLAVHHNSSLYLLAPGDGCVASGIPSSFPFATADVPFPLHEEVIVGSINNGDHAVTEGNLFGFGLSWGRIIHSRFSFQNLLTPPSDSRRCGGKLIGYYKVIVPQMGQVY
jgi:hypothetical protein